MTVGNKRKYHWIERVSRKGDLLHTTPLSHRVGKYLYYVDDGTVTDVVGFEPYAIIEPAGGGGRQR